MNNTNIVLTRIRPLYYTLSAHVNNYTKNFQFKCGSMLNGFVKTSVTQHKGWEMLDSLNVEVVKRHGIFDKISRPSRRRKVLNNLFIENITDCISTTDVAPEVMGLGVEISGVNISQDFKVLKVYWQTPVSQHGKSEEIEQILNTRAPQIRAELISRNVLGKVPHIYFVQDTTNARLSAFEEALANADMGPAELARTIPEQEFLKNMFKFKNDMEQEDNVEPAKPVEEINEDPNGLPVKPYDMRTDVLGLDHEKLMSRVLKTSSRMKKRDTMDTTAVTESSCDNLDNIPGIALCDDDDTNEYNGEVKRSLVLKKFLLDRKVQLEKIRKASKDTRDDDFEQSVSNDDFPSSFADIYSETDFFSDDEFQNDCDEMSNHRE